MSITPNRDPISRISRRFDLNRRRVESLINIYRHDNQKSLPISQRQDTLRSAVVFIHAMLEDVLRELIRWKAPIDNEEFANLLRFQIGADTTKENSYVKQVSIHQLAKLTEKSVDKIIASAIDVHLEKRSFNDETQITHAIKLIGIPPADIKEFLPNIIGCVKRRHSIVHRGDRSEHNVITHGRPMSITVKDVQAWNVAVSGLVERIFEVLPAKSPQKAPKKPDQRPLPKVPTKTKKLK